MPGAIPERNGGKAEEGENIAMLTNVKHAPHRRARGEGGGGASIAESALGSVVSSGDQSLNLDALLFHGSL